MNKVLREKIKREKEVLKDYFGCEIEPTRSELFGSDLKSKGLGLHFIPSLSYKEFPQGALSPFFLRLQNKGKLSSDSLKLSKGWVLVEKKPKLIKKKIWLSKNSFFDLLKNTGLSARKICGLSPQMKFPGLNRFTERLGTTRKEIDNKVLSSMNTKLNEGNLALSVRIPTYLEYVYLGKNFYNDWGRTKTWEWLKDKLKDERFLAAGREDASTLGADGYNHWSTILSYRVIYEIENRKTK